MDSTGQTTAGAVPMAAQWEQLEQMLADMRAAWAAGDEDALVDTCLRLCHDAPAVAYHAMMDIRRQPARQVH